MTFLDRVQRLLGQFPWLQYLMVFAAVIGVPAALNFAGELHWFFLLLIWAAGLGLLFLAGAWHMLMRLIFPAPVRPPPVPMLTPEMKQAMLAAALLPPDQARHQRLRETCLRLHRLSAGAEDRVSMASFAPGLQQLEWSHLKLLLARKDLLTMESAQSAADLEARLESLKESADLPSLTPAARKSLEDAIALTGEQLRHLAAHRSRIVEIDADLLRIEAEVDLALQRAMLDPGKAGHGLPGELAAEHVRAADWKGAQPPSVKELDEWHAKCMQSGN